MADATGIEWADATWNPVVGCSVVSPGCTHCYAMQLAAARLDGNAQTPAYAGTTQRVNGNAVWTGKVARNSDAAFTQPLRWKKPRRIFVNSMGDLFHESVPDAWIDEAFAVMALAPQHTFQILTKRAARMRDYVCTDPRARIYDACAEVLKATGAAFTRSIGTGEWPLPNVWLGVSCEDQARADERAPLLLDTPAAVRFVSAEPLLGPIDFTHIDLGAGAWCDALSGMTYWGPGTAPIDPRKRLDWIIAGGESGKGARPMHPDWARGLRDQCATAGVPFFFKQWGEWKEWLHDVDGPHVVEIDEDNAEAAAVRIAREVKTPGWLTRSGRFFLTPDAFYAANTDEPARVMERIGKHAAGRRLDGVTHDAAPAGKGPAG